MLSPSVQRPDRAYLHKVRAVYCSFALASSLRSFKWTYGVYCPIPHTALYSWCPCVGQRCVPDNSSREMMIHPSPGAFLCLSHLFLAAPGGRDEPIDLYKDPLSAADGLTQGPANEAGARLAPRSFLPLLDLILRGDRGDEPARFQLIAVSLRAAVGG